MKECAMKECGCINSYSIYPCGHEYNTWEYCAKAKARNLLSCGPPTCCPSRKRIMVPPNLEETCGSTCLTRPFQCGHCGAPKQLGWRCARCHYLRGMGTWLWDQCPGCLELGPLDPKFGLCGKCKRGRGPSGRSLPCLDKAKPALSWKCHKCARAVRTELQVRLYEYLR
ncbi:hypothetical protein F5Y04DRAFT_292277 [Hypomontagnella monticulosa]|nr:hypothetical protein F5Y04DRAFT_292277 [Hypomontagnella monticulosa]